jgi:hypothetical protein
MRPIIRSTTMLMTGAFLACIASVHAQEVTEGTLDPSQVTVMSPHAAVRSLQAAARQSASFNADISAAGSALKVWPYTFLSPRDGNTYSGNVVGASPFNHGARTTNIPVVIIPLRIMFTGTVRNFDPTSPDDGCLGAGNTALSLSEASPIFNAVPNYMINGVNMGNVTFPDAFQRASFYGAPSFYAQISPAYHLGFNVTVAAAQTISVANGTSSGDTYSTTGDCSTNTTAMDNPPRLGVIDVNYIDPLLNAIIANLGISRSQFPLFLIYGVVMSNGSALNLNNCCILGYHNGAQILNTTDPEQTYGISEYDQGYVFGGVKNITALAHEVLEWVNDPSTNNLVPAWGNIGQVSGCQDNLEVGDPLSGSLMPGVLMPNGVTYYPQELAFFSWYLDTPFVGAGGKFSSNGTFGGDAKACPPGGTN